MSIECQQCFGESHGDCEYCDHGRAHCEECLRDGFSERAVEALDFSDQGGPRVWPVCGTHARELKARRERLALREEI